MVVAAEEGSPSFLILHCAMCIAVQGNIDRETPAVNNIELFHSGQNWEGLPAAPLGRWGEPESAISCEKVFVSSQCKRDYLVQRQNLV